MKRKYVITLLTLSLCALAGCGSVKNEYVMSTPDGRQTVVSRQEAKEIQETQEKVQEELGISDEEVQQIYQEFAGYESEYKTSEAEAEVEQEETIEEAAPQEKFDIHKALGKKLTDRTVIMGNEYTVYENGAVLILMPESFSTVPETIDYEGATYNVVGLGTIAPDVEEFEIPSFIKYFMYDQVGGNDLSRVHGKYILKHLVIPDTVEYVEISSMYLNFLEDIIFPADIEYGTININSAKSLKEFDFVEGMDLSDVWLQACDALKKIDFPKEQGTLYRKQEIDLMQYVASTQVEEITVPENIENLHAGTSRVMTRLEIPASTGILSFESSDNEVFEEFVIQDNDTMRLGYIQFRHNPSLKRIVLNGDASNLSLEISGQCQNLEYIEFPNNTQTIDEKIFKGLDTSKITLVIPEGLVEYYSQVFPDMNVIAK